jgi:2-polyprenyl-6-methoxyphenol hydroxylase-like FAD-dependent oxidoreductase
MNQTSDYDVAIVGYGPVGQLLAKLLGQGGHTVVAVERYADIYPMPRAVHFDDEVARILQAVGIRADENPIIEPYDDWYEWRNADRRTLLKVDWRGVGPSWWHTANFFAQPDLERELDARVREHANVTVRREVTAVALDQDDDGVTLSVRPSADGAHAVETIRARYVVGCDGANSTVRDLLGVGVADLGFFFDWLIVDMVPREPMAFDPPAWQLCDPARPTTIVPGGPGRRRWEFMALPGEDVRALNEAGKAWELLRPWGLTPDNAVMERHTVYRFQARWAECWRVGRALIAGDAAHLMPPFAGQGMCAGLRDAVNLAWKLDLVLRGLAADAVLDTYGSERAPHVRHFIDLSIELGRVICVPGREEAAERDRHLLAVVEDPGLAPPPAPAPRIGAGVLAPGDPGAGLLSVQSRIAHQGAEGLFDDVLGHGWFVLTAPGTELALSAAAREVVRTLGARVLRIAPPGSAASTDVTDLDGRYAAWFRELGAPVAIVRPDFYVYAAPDADSATRALELLGTQLSLTAAHETAVPA